MASIAAAGLPVPEREFRFHPTRKWRLDFAWPAVRLGVELEGGIYRGGGHTSVTGIKRDIVKGNALTLDGWRLLRFHGDQVRSGEATETIRRALEVTLEAAAPAGGGVMASDFVTHDCAVEAGPRCWQVSDATRRGGVMSEQQAAAADAGATRIAEIRALMRGWSTERFTRMGHPPAARSLLADAGLELLGRLDALTADLEASRAREAALVEAAARIGDAPTPTDRDGRCWYCAGGLGIGPHGHDDRCPLVALRLLAGRAADGEGA